MSTASVQPSEEAVSAAPAKTESPPASGMAPEHIAKSLAAIAAVFYVAGFLTTNAYLYRLGVSDFSLLRTRFVLTGVLTVVPLVLALVGGIYAAVDTAAYGRLGRTTGRASLWILGDVAVPCVLYFFLFWFVSGNDPVASARDAALLSAMCAVVVIAFMAVLALFRASGQRPVSHLLYRRKSISYERFTRWSGVPDGVVEYLVFAVAGPLLLFAYIAVFGDYFYPLIPEQIGGGRPRHVQLLVATDAIPGVRELGLEIADGAPLSPPVQLLWEGEQAYVIRLPPPREGTVVQLSRGLVDGVVTGAVVPRAGSASGGAGAP